MTVTPSVPDAFWRSASIFNLFRVFVALGLLGINLAIEGTIFGSSEAGNQLNILIGSYLLAIAGYGLLLRRRWPAFHILLTVQVGADIAVIVLVMQLVGGFNAGVGMMLLPYLAAAGLVSRGHTTLFHAALASIALLLQQAYFYFSQDTSSGLFPAAMLSIACFATAWLAHRLAEYATASEQLAEQRGADLANMAQINRLVIQDVSDGVLVLDDTGVIRQFNQQAERLLGSGMQAGRTGLADCNPMLAQSLERWRQGDHSTVKLEVEATRRLVRPRFMPIRSGGGLSGIVVFLEDIERLQSEAQQIKLAALGRLTANIAHEIRNPLGAIGHAAQLLAEEVDSPTGRRLTQIIADNTSRLDRMVREVLELNRRDRAQPVQIRLHDWLISFLDEFRQVERIDMLIVLECPLGAVVRFDEGQLHQVLWNLCRNAWRHGRKDDGSLRLVVAAEAERWVLEVRDDGPGVPPELVSQLFEPFFTTEAKGTGLGLYIAREICAGNDSVLEYIQAPYGACFRISFKAQV
ncbi:two-component system sensor histidine kinase NtrB [Chitinimonas lacunae]|uniref:histidine kinase n=1 Tax=Chitinimonas lacunae TaxID=1963018 RepID=A0ABV8MTW2_9NEIS